MSTIKLYEHPFAPAVPQVFEVDSLAEWLLAHYGDTPQLNVQIFKGEPSAETEISRDAEAILACDAAEYTVLQSPGTGVEEVWMFYAIMAVAAVAAYVLMPKPVLPGSVGNRTQASPNNQLGNRENKVRLLERVEDIYGTVSPAVPSLMMPTYLKYVRNQKVEYGYYCVGRGYHDIAKLQDSDTLISEITRASAAVYAPFTSPNSGDSPILSIGDAIIDAVLTVTRLIAVDGITLRPLNALQFQATGGYDFVPDVGGGTITQTSDMTAFQTTGVLGNVSAGDHVTVTMALTPDYSGTYEVASVVLPYTLVLTPASTAAWTIPVSGTASVQVAGVSDWTDWITLPNADRTEVWCNIVAASGLFKDAGSGHAVTSVDYTIEIEQLDVSLVPLGVVETITGTLTGATSEEVAETVEHVTAWTGPARARMRRTTAYSFGFTGTIVDEIKWVDLYSVSPVTKTHFGNKTTIHTITEATPRATAVKTRQLNCIASRLLPIYDGITGTFSGAFDADGRHVSGTIAATSKLVDIIAAVSVDPKIGARDLATEVDMAQIWGVQQLLDAWTAEAGQFNYTFDSDNISYEETIISIANAGFCIAYRQNGKIRLAFDRAQAASTALFTHRNKKPKAETLTRKFASDAEYDGVEFIYVDPDSHQHETITLPLDGSATKLKKFEIAGMRSFAQAWLRANREYYKLRGQRITIESTATPDARLVLPNARIDIVDNTRFKSYDGEVTAQSGLTLTLSQDVAFLPATAHSVVLMKRDGSLQSIAATAGPDANQVVLAGAPAEAIVTAGGAAGIRTIFSFAADSARGAMAYLVQELDISDGQYVTIRAINYADTYYQKDYVTIPAKATIIN